MNNDNTGLNGIQLLCTDGETSNRIDGIWGDWDENWSKCPIGEHVKKVALRGMVSQGSGDDFGATNVKIVCSGGSEVVGTGYDKGTWTQSKGCGNGERICGVRAMIEGSQGKGDDTALNRIQLSCCQDTGNNRF